MLLSAPMNSARPDLFHGLFAWHPTSEGPGKLIRRTDAPQSVPDPDTGHHLAIATVDVGSSAICPDCQAPGEGGFVSFVADLRMAYACPACQRFVWVAGA